MQLLILGIIRHLLTSAGGALAAKGVITAAEADTVAGALMTVAGVGWSIYEKIRRP